MSEAVVRQERKKPEKLTKKDIVIGWLFFWFGRMSCHSNAKKGGNAFALFMGYLCRKFYNKEDLADCMTRHSEFYMSDYVFGGCIHGIVLAMEEQRANELYENGETTISTELISSVKTGLMGPFAGFGDTVTQTVLFVIVLSIAQPMAAAGNYFGAFLAFLSHACWRPTVSFLMTWPGYHQGKSFAAKLTGSEFAKKVMTVAGIVSMMMMGALTASTVKFNPTVVVGSNDLATTLNNVFPGITGIGPVFLVWFLLKKNVSTTVIILGALVVCTLLAVVGIF